MAQTINERFLDFQVLQQVRWYRFGSFEARNARRILTRVDRDLARILQDYEIGPQGQRAYSRARYEALRVQIANLLTEVHRREVAPLIEQAATEATLLAAEAEEGAFQRILPAGVDVTTPNLGILQTIAHVRPFNGEVLGEWIKDLQRNDLRRTWRTIQGGLIEGKPTPDIVRDVIGRGTLNYRDGVREVSRRGVTTLVRTAINHAANMGRQALWEQNEDLLKGVRWVATLDMRTTPICRDRDGEVYDVDDGPRPPAHPNCRSTMVAVVKSWRELGFDMDELPRGTRESMDGKVPQDLTYYQWLDKQDATRQREVLGATRYRLWKEAGVSPDRFVDDGTVLTIEDLRKRLPSAFKTLNG